MKSIFLTSLRNKVNIKKSPKCIFCKWKNSTANQKSLVLFMWSWTLKLKTEFDVDIMRRETLGLFKWRILSDDWLCGIKSVSVIIGINSSIYSLWWMDECWSVGGLQVQSFLLSKSHWHHTETSLSFSFWKVGSKIFIQPTHKYL